MAIHQFKLESSWPGGRNEVGYIDAGQLQTKISIPSEMDGPGVGTNPDEMLLGAAATCYLITMAAMMERAKLPVTHLELSSVGDVDVTHGIFTYKRITHKPLVRLKKEASEDQLARAKKIAQQAESSCMISRAIKGNVDIVLEEDISIS